jgi:hypothetical protein
LLREYIRHLQTPATVTAPVPAVAAAA